MKLHIVGGFLGSGKTTAILAAARELIARGLNVGIITNDQGRYLVDTAFFRLSNLPTVEVTGGCFCCNYDDLDSRLDKLIAQAHPDVIFAESVGSCADLVATVVRPLLALRARRETPASFTVVCDSRLLRLRLLDEELPFSDEVTYIFDKQIEEAGLLVINKIDLLSAERLAELRRLAAERFPDKIVLFQNALEEKGVRAWLEQLESQPPRLPRADLDIDYYRYGAGEAQLAWLDEDIKLYAPAGRADILEFLTAFLSAVRDRRAGIGHIKILIQAGDTHLKLSIPTLEEPGWQDDLPDLPGGWMRLLLNARLELPADELQQVLEHALEASGLAWQAGSGQAFHPGQPKPTHRMAAGSLRPLEQSQ